MNTDQKRQQRNRELMERVKRGESTALMPASATWFQPRPIIKKDAKAMAKLYKEGK